MFWDKPINSGLVSLLPVTQPNSSAWLPVGLVTMGETCGWSQNTHSCSYFIFFFLKWMNCSHINTLDRCLVFNLIGGGRVFFFLSFLQGQFTPCCPSVLLKVQNNRIRWNDWPVSQICVLYLLFSPYCCQSVLIRVRRMCVEVVYYKK